MNQIRYQTMSILGLEIFYREAGSEGAPPIVLLHGFPSSSHMYRNLLPVLAHKFYLIAPDYPGFGNSSTPDRKTFRYTFDNLSEVMFRFIDKLGLDRFSLYMQDYGGPIGFRLAARQPKRVEALIIQNANVYEEGFTELGRSLEPFWANRTKETETAVRQFLLSPEGIRKLYTGGARHPESIPPDTWNLDVARMNQPCNDRVQLDLLHDYPSNMARYPEWQAYLREWQPPALVVWGKNDPFFGPEGAFAFKRDLKNVEVCMLDTGHFALEEDCEEIAWAIRRFMRKNVGSILSRSRT
jgi:pimeloyl-ACP methyl ester carboxylesterase